MSVVLFGATGNIGREILAESLSRGIRVTAVVHRREPAPHPLLTVVRGDIANVDDVTKVVAGHEAVLSAYSPGLRDYSPQEATRLIEAAHASLFEGARRAKVRRVILVGGVGSLEASPGVDVVDSDFYKSLGGQQPAADPEHDHRVYTFKNREILRALKRGEHDPLDWTYVSPPLHIVSGERTGKFRLGTDQLLRAPDGDSHISEADFAIAILDAYQQNRAVRQRFTAAY